jgi:hypothetical protein
LLRLVLASIVAPLRPTTAQVSDAGPRTTFILARYAVRGTRALYAGYGAGSWQGVIGLVDNPASSYLEALVGIAKGFTLAPRQSVTVALAVADASDSRYGQVYTVPSLSAGRLALSGTSELYLPLQAQGVFQYYLSPLSLHFAIRPGLQLGATYVLAMQEHTPTGHGLGPSLKVAVPHGTLTLDWIIHVEAYRTQTRLTFQATS